MPHDFFVVQDYGQGGVWAVIRAESAAQVRERYPEIEVFAAPPPSLDTATVALLRRTPAVGIDDPPTGWLADLVAQRSADSQGAG